jgi:hypothetical protein
VWFIGRRPTRVYGYDAAGHVVEEFDGNGGTSDEYLFFRGQRITRCSALAKSDK